MSTRAIAPAVGVQDSAVRKDLRRISGGSAGPTSTEGINRTTGEVLTNYNTGEVLAPQQLANVGNRCGRSERSRESRGISRGHVHHRLIVSPR